MNTNFKEITSLYIVLSMFIHKISSNPIAKALTNLQLYIFTLRFCFLGTFWYEAKAICFQIVMMLMTSTFSWAVIRARLKALFYFHKLIFGRQRYILLHWNSQKILLVSPYDTCSFGALTALNDFVLFNQSNHLAILKRIVIGWFNI